MQGRHVDVNEVDHEAAGAMCFCLQCRIPLLFCPIVLLPGHWHEQCALVYIIGEQWVKCREKELHMQTALVVWQNGS